MENAFHAAQCAASTGRVEIRAETKGDILRIAVVDNGPGVHPDDRERIFQPYVSTKKGGDKPQGTGLGLSIARSYAESIAAKFELDSTQDRTCFAVTLPLWREPHE